MVQIFELSRLSMWVMRRRLRQAWGLSAVASLGILAAVVLLSATALYSRVLAEAGVRHALFSESPVALHTQVLAQNRPLGPEDYDELRAIAEAAVEQRIGHLTVGLERFGRTRAGMALTTNPAPQQPPLGSSSGRPFFMTGFREHSRILEGGWPQRPGTVSTDGVEMDAVIGHRVSNDMGYDVGDRLFIIPFRAAPEERVILNVVGVAEPVDPRAEYWMGYPNQFSVNTVGEQLVVPFYVTEPDFLQALGRRFPTAVGDFGFYIFIDPSHITAGTVDATQEAMDGLETDLNKSYPRTFVFSRLGLTLDEFERDLTLARVPIYVFVSLVVVVVLYFLVLITGILGRSQGDELGLLRSRGAGVAQVCGVLLLTEGVVALAAVGIGPLLAWLIVRYLLLPTFGTLGGGPIDVVFAGDMFWMGAVGAVLSVGVLAASAAGRARTGMADALATRSRPPSVSFFHRYYLDILAVLAVGLVWWQLQERDGFVSRTLATRGLDVDPTLILGPVLGLLAAALLLMRALPLLVRLVVWVCMRSGPGWSSITLARLARDPVLPSSLAVMLMLASALGVFGATFQSSLSRSQSEQTMYRVGGDVLISGPGVNAGVADRLEAVPGVRAVSPVLRDSVTLVEGHAGAPALLMAVEPRAMAQAMWFRDDFADATLPELAALIRTTHEALPEERYGVPLPSGIERIGVWLEVGDLRERELQADINVWARLADAKGRYRNVGLGGFAGQGGNTGEGWQFFAGDLPERLRHPAGGTKNEANREWSLAAIFFSTSSFVKVTAGRIHLDDVTAFGPSLPVEGRVVEEFDSLGNWTPLGTRSGTTDRLGTGPAAARAGASGLTFSWDEPFGGEQRGMHISPVPLPLPAIGGPGLRPGQTVRVGHGRTSIPVEVVAVSDLFPTVTSFQRPFLLLDLDGYLSYLRLLPPASAKTVPQDIWLSLDPAQERQAVIAEVESVLSPLSFVTDRGAAAELASRNPLAGGGWNGLTGLSMTGIGLAVVTALLFHSAASVRAGRVDTAVARALGLSRRQLFLSLAVEKWLMAGVAIAAGAAIGYWPGLELVQMLDLSANRAGPVPPMIPEVHGLLLASVLAGLVVAVMASAVFGALLAQRIRPVDVLREGA